LGAVAAVLVLFPLPCLVVVVAVDPDAVEEPLDNCIASASFGTVVAVA
jgi:hypothetical protein